MKRRAMRRRISLLAAGIGGVATKELRGRMRGWRAFAILTVYLAALAGVVFLVYLGIRQSSTNGGSATTLSSAGSGIFQVLMVLQLILVVFLAPASTSGAISLEREKQTLDLLAATPVPSLAVVIGKLVSALGFMLLQVIASLPLVAIVFVFGGVAPDDLLRAYLVLLISGFGFGCIGIAFSAIVRRSQTASVLTWLSALVLTFGTAFVFYQWVAMADSQKAQRLQVEGMLVVPQPAVIGPNGLVVDDTSSTTTPTAASTADVVYPPDWMLWLNPGLAMGDVLCGADVNPYSDWCGGVTRALGQDPNALQNQAVQVWKGGVMMGNGVMVGGGGVGIAQAFPVAGNVAGIDPTSAVMSTVRDRIWPRIAAAWLIASLLLIGLATLMVRPRGGRRSLSLRPRRPHLPRRSSAPGAAPDPGAAA
jgi:ABC-type transport system involved in multi-copper enzyme maturation permease subunit